MLSVISSLAEYKNGQRIKDMFDTDEVNEQGVYAVTLTKNGK
jgi:hypothetical protein